MRLPEPIEARGFFWLPGEPDNEVPGLLRISDSGEIELEALGLFRDFRAVMEDRCMEVETPQEYDRPSLTRIVGIIEKGRSVTLDGCKPRHEQFGSGPSKSLIHADLAFIGRQYEAAEELKFSKLEFSADGLDEWLGVSGFDAQLRRSESQNIESFRIHYKCPDNVSLMLPDQIGLTFTFKYQFVWGAPPVTEAKVSQKAYISLSLTGPQPIEYLFSLMSKICKFLSFAVDQTVSIDSISGYLGQEIENAEGCQLPVEIYGRIGDHSEEKPQIQLHRMLFSYENIDDHLERVLAKWLGSYKRFEPALNLYFASKTRTVGYAEVRFLMLAQGIEVLHRRVSKDKCIPEKQFRRRIEDILGDVKGRENREWLKKKLGNANQLTLRERIAGMCEPFSDLLGGEESCKAFAAKVANTRNYLTHYGSRLENKAASEAELWNLRRKLEGLWQLHLLKLIGVHAESIRSIVNANEELGRKLGIDRGESRIGVFTEVELPSPPPESEA